MALSDFSIFYDNENKVVIAKIISKYANLNDPTFYIDSTELIRKLLIENNCFKLFADYSLIGIQMSYDMEYYYAKNINKVFDYPDGTISSIYEGEFYSKKKWALIKNIFKEDGVTNIEFFGDYDEAMAWLKSK